MPEASLSPTWINGPIAVPNPPPEVDLLSVDAATEFAAKWVAAWNSHDLDLIMSHWRDECEFTSAIAAQLVGDHVVRGKAALRAYWAKGLEVYPDLRFEMKTVFVGADSVVLGYTNQKGQQCAELIQLDAEGYAIAGIAHYA
jgi:hypothetical protein